jgi:hypothetical protein
MLMTVSRIAVWNRNRVVYVIAMGAWVTNLACLIRGKFLLQIVQNRSQMCLDIRYCAGERLLQLLWTT